MPSPITLAQFKELTLMPGDAVDEVETRRGSGYTLRQLDRYWNWIQAVLRKRYDVAAMAVNPPETAIGWLVDLTTKELYDARGWDPSGKSDETAVLERFKAAKVEIKEAADSEKGLSELPLLKTDTTDGVSKGGPMAYSEQSPYTWATLQQEAGEAEDDA
jgi:hypothetical protein